MAFGRVSATTISPRHHCTGETHDQADHPALPRSRLSIARRENYPGQRAKNYEIRKPLPAKNPLEDNDRLLPLPPFEKKRGGGQSIQSARPLGVVACLLSVSADVDLGAVHGLIGQSIVGSVWKCENCHEQQLFALWYESRTNTTHPPNIYTISMQPSLTRTTSPTFMVKRTSVTHAKIAVLQLVNLT